MENNDFIQSIKLAVSSINEQFLRFFSGDIFLNEE